MSKSFAQEIQKFSETSGISLRKLFREAGISYSSYAWWIRGEHKSTPESERKVREAMGKLMTLSSSPEQLPPTFYSTCCNSPVRNDDKALNLLKSVCPYCKKPCTVFRMSDKYYPSLSPSKSCFKDYNYHSKKESTYVSSCCGARIKSVASDEGTGFSVCTACNKACDMQGDACVECKTIPPFAPLSYCCGARIEAGKGGTSHYHVCTSCKKYCDVKYEKEDDPIKEVGCTGGPECPANREHCSSSETLEELPYTMRARLIVAILEANGMEAEEKEKVIKVLFNL